MFHFDCFWMREFRWCDFEWDPRTFPEPEAMLARIKDRGLRVCVWINPYIAQLSPLFEEGRAHGYLVQRPDGSVWQWDKWQAGMALVDFTNPAAAAVVLSASWSACWTRVWTPSRPTSASESRPTWSGTTGRDPERMHNYYTQLYNRTVFELLRRRRGEGEAVVFARSATAGGQQYPVHWGGDCESSFEAMAETLRGGLSLAASGFAYWSHDIGGFEGTPDAGVFKRWLAFGLLSSHSRLHGSNSYRVPWAFDDEAVDVARRFTELKMTLMPYLARLADRRNGVRHPVAATDGATSSRTTPPYRTWTPSTCSATPSSSHRFSSRRSGAVLRSGGPLDLPPGRRRGHRPALACSRTTRTTRCRCWSGRERCCRRGARRDRPDYHYADGIALHVYGVEVLRHSTVRIPGTDDIDDSVFDVEFIDGTLTVSRTSGPEVSWSVVLPAGSRPASATGGRLESTSDGGQRIATSEASISIELLA